MATYTQNYSLHQWEDSDDFLRTDFNEDFAKIDTALGRAERSATSNAYNIYNLILQNYYESKYTGYKSALIFDGFMDDSGISSLSEGFSYVESDSLLYLDGTGQEDVDNYYGNTYSTNLGNSLGSISSSSVSWTATGYGEITSLSVYINGSATLTITDATGAERYSGSRSTSSLNTVTYTLTEYISVVPGDVLTFKLTNNNSVSSMTIYRSGGSNTFGFLLTANPTCFTQGTFVSADSAVGTWDSSLAWVRHVGGTCSLALNSWDMVATETRTLTLEDGTQGLETAFSLSGVEGDDMTLTLTYNIEEGTAGKVFDYGIFFL